MPDPDLPSQASELADDRFRFWTAATATTARRSGRSRKDVATRVAGAFRAVCVTVQPTLVLELGAHEGTFSRWAKRTFPDARCLALEANPYVHEKHRHRLAQDGVEYEHLAASDTTGPVTLNIPTKIHKRERTRTSRMASLTTHLASSGHEEVEVRGVRVDELVQPGPDDRVVAWIDVEGASGPVLRGAREVLARTDVVYIEVESTATWDGQWLDLDVVRFLERLGKIPVLRDIQRPHQYNLLLLDHRLAAQTEVARRVARALAPPRGD